MARNAQGRRSTPRRWAVLAAGLLAATGTALPASAAWQVAGAGAGRGEADEMHAPSDVVATCLPGMVIRVRWTPSALRTGFVMQRSVAGGPWTTIATAEESTASAWDDHTLVNLLGLAVRWRVKDTYRGWTSTPSPASDVRMISLAGVCL